MVGRPRLKVGDVITFWDDNKKVYRSQRVAFLVSDLKRTWRLETEAGARGSYVRELEWRVAGCGPIVSVNGPSDVAADLTARLEVEVRVQYVAIGIREEVKRLQRDAKKFPKTLLLQVEKALRKALDVLERV